MGRISSFHLDILHIQITKTMQLGNNIPTERSL